MHIQRPRPRRGLALVLLILCAACFPYRGVTQMPLPPEPFLFTDAATARPIERVLVIPSYGVFRGASSGGGHGPGGGSYGCYLAHPFLYGSGTPFTPKLPKTTGIVWGLGWAFTGAGTALEGVTVFAHGYEPLFIRDLWLRERAEPIALNPIPDGDFSVAQRLSVIARGASLRGADAAPFVRCGKSGDSVDVRLTPEEIRMISAYAAERE